MAQMNKNADSGAKLDSMPIQRTYYRLSEVARELKLNNVGAEDTLLDLLSEARLVAVARIHGLDILIWPGWWGSVSLSNFVLFNNNGAPLDYCISARTFAKRFTVLSAEIIEKAKEVNDVSIIPPKFWKRITSGYDSETWQNESVDWSWISKRQRYLARDLIDEEGFYSDEGVPLYITNEMWNQFIGNQSYVHHVEDNHSQDDFKNDKLCGPNYAVNRRRVYHEIIRAIVARSPGKRLFSLLEDGGSNESLIRKLTALVESDPKYYFKDRRETVSKNTIVSLIKGCEKPLEGDEFSAILSGEPSRPNKKSRG